MKAKTLKALKGSIKKWEAIVARTGVDRGGKNCPLCREFPSCEGCPVMRATGQEQCFGTPYYGWKYAAQNVSDLRGYALANRSTASQRYAEKMLEFLKALLPKRKAQKVKKARGAKAKRDESAKTRGKRDE